MTCFRVAFVCAILCSAVPASQSETKAEQIPNIRDDFSLWRLNFPKEYKLWKTLYASAKKGNLTVLTQMIESGADVNRRDDIGWSPLTVAVSKNQDETVELLLKNKADPNLGLYSGWNALHLASENGNEKIVNMLIANGARVNQTINSIGWSPIHFAAKNGHDAIVKMLIENGADVNLVTKEGWTAKDLAQENNRLGIVKFLQEKMEETEPDNSTKFTDTDRMVQTDDIVINPLLIAAKNGNLTNAEWLIEHGADVNLADGNGWTPLLTAAWNHREQMVDLLLRNGAKVNSSLSTGWNALDAAAEIGHLPIAEMLVNNGADINKPMKATGRTPLHVAAESGHDEIVDLLIRKGANVKILTPEGMSALDLAEQNGRGITDPDEQNARINIIKLLKAAAEVKEVSKSSLWYLNIIGIVVVIIFFIAGIGYFALGEAKRSELMYRYGFC